jgi:HAD superfamily hydrolase (TIGR01509 family)
MIRTVLWDNDGVLVDTEALYFQATREVLATIGADLTRDLFIQLSLEEGRSAFDLAREREATEEAVERLRSTRNERYSALLRSGVPMFEGADEVLSRLHGRVRMGVVTSSHRDHFEIIHRSTGLLRYFEFVLTREDYDRAKPHPDPYQAALDRHGLRADESVVVEDSVRGLLAARGAGIRCIVVPNTLTRDGNFDGAHAVVADLREAEAELERLLKA